jgi:serine/threonine protein kinase
MSDKNIKNSDAVDAMAATLRDGDSIEFSRKYDIVATIGEGGMGVVMLASTPFIDGNVQVALKVFDKNNMPSEDSLERFHREAELLRMASHPNIAKFIDFWENSTNAYLAMEYINGSDLDEHVEEGDIGVSLLMDVIVDILDALIYMNEVHGMSHRDLKPGNIVLKEVRTEGESDIGFKGVLIDFGNTKIVEDDESESLTQISGMMSGTPGYTAPGVTLDVFHEKDDVFSLAATVMYVLFGDNPFEVDGDMQASMFEIMKGEFDLGIYEGTALGWWIRINTLVDRDERFSLRQASDSLNRIKENPSKPSSEHFVRTIASDQALVHLSEKVDALHNIEDANTMAHSLIDLGFDKSWLEDALEVNKQEPETSETFDIEDYVDDDAPEKIVGSSTAAPELALIENLISKKKERDSEILERAKEAKHKKDKESSSNRGGNGALIFVSLLLICTIGFIGYMFAMGSWSPKASKSENSIEKKIILPALKKTLPNLAPATDFEPLEIGKEKVKETTSSTSLKTQGKKPVKSNPKP